MSVAQEPRAAGPAGGQGRLAAVFRAQAAGPGQSSGGLLDEAVTGGLEVAEGVLACSLTAMAGEEFETLASSSPATRAGPCPAGRRRRTGTGSAPSCRCRCPATAAGRA
jgi:hypothetical protein